MENNNTELKNLLKALGLSHTANNLENILQDDHPGNNLSIDFFKTILKQELEYQEKELMYEKLRKAAFPEYYEKETYDFNMQKSITKEQFELLIKMDWIRHSFNLFLFGSSGIGKTFTAVFLGKKAIEMGYNVYFITMRNLLKVLAKQNKTDNERIMEQIKSSDLLIIDELSYNNKISRLQGVLLFDLINNYIYRKKATILTSNNDFIKWSECFEEQDVATAIYERLINRHQIIEMDGNSIRVENHKTLF